MIGVIFVFLTYYMFILENISSNSSRLISYTPKGKHPSSLKLLNFFFSIVSLKNLTDVRWLLFSIGKVYIFFF